MLRSIALVFCLSLAFSFGSGLVHGQVQLQPKMGDPVPGLDADQLALFESGLVLFEQELVDVTGLGPVFNKESCANCHNQGAIGGTGTQTVTRFGFVDKNGFDPLDQFGGSLLQSAGINLLCQEVIPPESNYDTLRITTSSFGIGLIEAIADAAIEEYAMNPPAGISGAIHMAPILESPGSMAVGRFGWKAQLATVMSFTADASLQEMGLTNQILPDEVDPNGINPPSLMDCDTVPDPEDEPDMFGLTFVDRVTAFQRFLAGPPQTPRSGMSGEQIFNDVGCADCHRAEYTTIDDPGLEDSLRNKTIRPYSDFLLHDMGLLGDGIVQGEASATEMRTPPLWGLRARTQILHDGRAGTLPGEDIFENLMNRAIEEHDGEGAASRDAYLALSSEDKNLLYAFLDSLGKAEFDLDGDGLVDEADFALFTDCFTPQGLDYTADDPCAVADIDQDGDVDLDDFDMFLMAYEGTNGTGDCDGNQQVDLFDILLGAPDCNQNALIDSCDIDNATSIDANGNGIPDECEANFLRGDCDTDGKITLADAIYHLDIMFQSSGDPIFCGDACDVNDDGSLDIADPVFNLQFQFAMGGTPPAPYPNCGQDGTPSNVIDCVSYQFCP